MIQYTRWVIYVSERKVLPTKRFSFNTFRRWWKSFLISQSGRYFPPHTNKRKHSIAGALNQSQKMAETGMHNVYNSMLNKFSMIDPHRIIMEVTEQDSIDMEKDIISNIKMLRGIGFRFAIDDAGTGYSSFHTIGEILPEIIKIDRDVIQDIHQNSIKESMLKGIMLVAKEVGSRVIAEGIEKKEEARVLSQHRVDLAQGYYYARPAVFNKQLIARTIIRRLNKCILWTEVKLRKD